jgi:hypothetical protein
MWPRETEIFPTLDVPVPVDVPPRSRLIALPPVGVGTDGVEGLTSYLTRLARAHAVNPRQLIREEFTKAADDPERIRWPARHAEDAGTMDGHGVYAEMFVSLTAELTTVPAVRYLTLLSLAELLPRTSAGVIARNPHWCPECLAEMVGEGREVWRPLVWSLDLYRVCHRHKRSLVTACSRCGKPQPFIPTFPDLGHCAHCHADLRDGDERSDAPVTEMDGWIAESLADMVAHLPDFDGMATCERFATFLRAAIDQVADGNRAAFCRRIGLPWWTAKNWLLRGERPSLPAFLSVARGMGLRSADIFVAGTGAPAKVSPTATASVRDRSKRPELNESKRKEVVEILARVQGDPTDTRSMTEIARALGVSCSCLRYWFPIESAAIRAKHAKGQLERVRRRREVEHNTVAEVVRTIAASGQYPGRRKVNEALSARHLSLAQPDMMESYRMAVRESYTLRSWPSIGKA